MYVGQLSRSVDRYGGCWVLKWVVCYVGRIYFVEIYK